MTAPLTPAATPAMIIMFLGKTVKEYLTESTSPWHERPACPICHQVCHFHGSYLRTVRSETERQVLTIERVRCPACRKTHALLPSFLAPYGQYPVAAHEAVVTEQAAGVPVEDAGAAFGQTVETSKRWLAAFSRKSTTVLGALRGALGRLGQYRWTAALSPLLELTRLCGALWAALGLPEDIGPGEAFARANLLLSREATACWV